MRENCMYGSMRGRAYPTTRGAPLYSTPFALIPNPCSSQLYLQQMLLQCDCNGFGTIGGTELLEYRYNVLLCGVR